LSSYCTRIIGTHDVTITATDASGNESVCMTTFTVNGQAIDFADALVCNDTINVSLNRSCQLVLTADMILENDGELCTDFLCIEVEDEDGNSHENFFGEDDIDKLFSIKIIDCNGSQNSCWGTVRIEEKQLPDVAWPEDIEILCVEPSHPDYFKIGTPEILNCENEIDLDYVDNYKEFERCLDVRAVIDRTWTVSDDEGNSQNHTQIITILPFSLDHVSFPEDISIFNPLDCNEAIDHPEILQPDSTGRPSIFGLPLLQNGGLCIFSIVHEDRIFDICDGSYEILRTWFVRDACGDVVPGLNPLEHVQVITVFDFEAPKFEGTEFENCIDSLRRSMNPWSCTYSGQLPIPEGLSDNCGTISLEAYVTGGGYIELEGSIASGDLSITAINMEAGQHEITYVAKDDCRNISICKFSLEVFDGIAPTSICTDSLMVSLAVEDKSGAATKIYAYQIDAGSHDNGCGPVDLSVIRFDNYDAGPVLLSNGKALIVDGYEAYHFVSGCVETGEVVDTLFDKNGQVESITRIPFVLAQDFVKICCNDLGQVDVVMIAKDKNGNKNICNVPVEIVENNGAGLYCPDYSISCVEDFSSHDVCSDGFILRTWYIDDDGDGGLSEGDNFCQQKISFDDVASAFDPSSIRWPAYYTGESLEGINLECDSIEGLTVWPDTKVNMYEALSCMSSLEDVDPQWCQQSCGLIGSSFELDSLLSNGACLSIIKRWTVIDWCVWQPNSVVDNELDNVVAVHDETKNLCGNCSSSFDAQHSVYFNMPNPNIDGHYQFEQIINIIDESVPVIVVADSIALIANSTSCFANAKVMAEAEDYCKGELTSDESLTWRVLVRNLNGGIVSDQLSRGATAEAVFTQELTESSYVVIWETSDACGNTAKKQTEIFIKDAIAPTAICLAGISTSLAEVGDNIEFWAKDFDVSSSDNCTNPDELLYSIYREEDDIILPNEEGFDNTAVIEFSCDDFQLNKVQELIVRVWDESYNFSECRVMIVADTLCPLENSSGFLTIAGEVKGIDSIGIADVRMHLNANLSEYPKSIINEDSGVYMFENNPVNHIYEILPSKVDEAITGLSTVDILMIQNHLVGIRDFDSPYRIISGDVNGDRVISALDLVLMHKIIIGHINEFPDGKSWRFIPADLQFVSLSNPWPFSENIILPNAKRDHMSEDFIGLKIGDVNFSHNGRALNEAEIRNRPNVSLHVPDQYIKKGDIVELGFSSDDFSEVRGFQLALAHEGLIYQNVLSGSIDIQDENINAVDPNRLKMSWVSARLESSNEVLFTLVFQASQDLQLKHSLTLDKSKFEPELYKTNNIVAYRLGLEVQEMQDTEAYILYQNQPNPFVRSSTISFYLPKSAEAIIKIYDVSGRELKKYRSTYPAGMNELIIKQSDIKALGMMYYQLEVDNFIDSKKMIILE